MVLKLLKKLSLSWCYLFTLLFPVAAQACSICFYGDPNSSANKALRLGIIALLLVLMAVFALFIKFFINCARKSKLSIK